MPGRVRSFPRGNIRLSDPVRCQVEHLARLAGVEPSEIVNFVLSEVLDGDAGAPAGSPPPWARAQRPAPTPRRRPARGANVIPIDRRRAAASARPPAPADAACNAASLRRQAAELCRVARAVRARAASACRAAAGARSRAGDLLAGYAC